MSLEMERNPAQSVLSNPVVQHDSEYLVFRIGTDKCAIRFNKVIDLPTLNTLTDFVLPVCGIRNITDFYGVPIPFIDLRKWCVAVTDLPALVVSSLGGDWVAIGVDEVCGIFHILPEQMTPASEMQDLPKANYLSGIGLVDGQFHLLLDIDQFLIDAKILSGYGAAA